MVEPKLDTNLVLDAIFFADDNNLKEGDGLVFELSECNSKKIELKIQILREDFRDELVPEDVEGLNIDNPIIIY